MSDSKATSGSGNKQYKDALFKYIFGSEERKQYTLELYNALNGTEYTDTSKIQYTTLEDVMYINYHNDVACMIDSNLINLWEEQSTWNPNMALRLLTYSVSMWSNYLYSTNQEMSSRKLVKIPHVNCVVLYNGTAKEPATSTVNINDNFLRERPKSATPLEFEVMVYNINTKAGKKLLSKCRPLLEYSWIITKVQEYTEENKRNGMVYPETLTAGIKKALKNIPRDYVLRNALLAKQEEVIQMLLTQFDAKRHDEIIFDNGFEEGLEQGKVQMIHSMLKNNFSKETVAKIAGLSLENLEKILAKKQD